MDFERKKNSYCSPYPTTNAKFCFMIIFCIKKNKLFVDVAVIKIITKFAKKKCTNEFWNPLSDPLNSILYYPKCKIKKACCHIYNSSYKNDLVKKPAAAKEMITMKVYRT